MSEEYVREKLYQAVDSLATSVAPLRDRLLSAGIILMRLSPGDFADTEHRAAFTAIGDMVRTAMKKGLLQ
jgi:hypothetical protein